MDGQHLRLLEKPEDVLTIQSRAARNARIDKLAVDRSRYRGWPSWHWCVEAQAPELTWSRLREDVTFDEALEAWRGIVNLPKATKTR